MIKEFIYAVVVLPFLLAVLNINKITYELKLKQSNLRGGGPPIPGGAKRYAQFAYQLK
jgi:hypothetical protein